MSYPDVMLDMDKLVARGETIKDMCQNYLIYFWTMKMVGSLIIKWQNFACLHDEGISV